MASNKRGPPAPIVARERETIEEMVERIEASADDLSPRQIHAIARLAIHGDRNRAALEVGVDRRVIDRWMSPATCGLAFRRALDLELRAGVAHSVRQIQQATMKAATSLEEILDSPMSEPKDRIAAARVILDHAHKNRTYESDEGRLSRAERESSASAVVPAVIFRRAAAAAATTIADADE